MFRNGFWCQISVQNLVCGRSYVRNHVLVGKDMLVVLSVLFEIFVSSSYFPAFLIHTLLTLAQNKI